MPILDKVKLYQKAYHKIQKFCSVCACFQRQLLSSGVYFHIFECCAYTAFFWIHQLKLYPLRFFTLVDEALVSALSFRTLPVWLLKGEQGPVQHLPGVRGC